MPAEGRWSEQPNEVSKSFYCVAFNVLRSASVRTNMNASKDEELCRCCSNIRVWARQKRVTDCDCEAVGGGVTQ